MSTRFTISQLRSTGGSYSLLDTDLLFGSIGTATYDLSSARISAKEYGDYLASTYTTNNKFILSGCFGIKSNGGDVASGVATPLTTYASLYETGASGETSTLAAGVEGQYKLLAMKTDGGGDMVVTVTNSKWGGSNTVTLGDAGDTCLLQYIDSKWYVISNNGCTFA